MDKLAVAEIGGADEAVVHDVELGLRVAEALADPVAERLGIEPLVLRDALDLLTVLVGAVLLLTYGNHLGDIASRH